jgi:ubiquinone/menaquinone biosynthesis C-methylase UbiE
VNSNEVSVTEYYHTRESRRGYSLFLKGTKHFGYYNPTDKPWQFNKALRQMEERLAKELGLRKGAKVLDAGCGMGDVASYLAANYKLHITGIDILDFNVAEAKKRLRERHLDDLVDVQKMSYAKLSFPNGKFDGLYTMETFVHAASPKKVLSEFYRVLKPGAKIVMFEYSRDPDSKMSPRAAQKFREINHFAAMPAFQRFNHGVQRKLMSEAGFENIEVKDITRNMLPMVRVFAYAAYIPYGLSVILGRNPQKYVNAMSAVELWRYRIHFRYNIYTANKPLK